MPRAQVRRRGRLGHLSPSRSARDHAERPVATTDRVHDDAQPRPLPGRRASPRRLPEQALLQVRVKKSAHPVKPTEARLKGVIVAAFGRHYEVNTTVGRLQCYPRGKRSRYACGDEAEIVRGGDGQGLIEKLTPRRNLLWRSDAFREKLIAANLSHIVIVVATEPGFSDLLVSRCIAAAESQDITPLIVLNKADLEARLPGARAQLAPFRKLGYEVIEVSALHGADGL